MLNAIYRIENNCLIFKMQWSGFASLPIVVIGFIVVFWVSDRN